MSDEFIPPIVVNDPEDAHRVAIALTVYVHTVAKEGMHGVIPMVQAGHEISRSARMLDHLIEGEEDRHVAHVFGTVPEDDEEMWRLIHGDE